MIMPKIAADKIWQSIPIETQNQYGSKSNLANILSKNPKEYTGHCLIDEEVLRQEGITDLEPYAVTPGIKLYQDLFLDE